MQLWTMKENYSIQSSLTALMVLQAHQDWMQVLGKEFAPLSSTTWSPWVTVYLWLRSSSAQGRLMAIDKQPAVCPIAIGEVLRCIIVRQSCLWWSPMSWLYLWAGLELWSCCACHASHPWEESTEVILLVDAKNVFDLLKRQLALFNIHRICCSNTH